MHNLKLRQLIVNVAPFAPNEPVMGERWSYGQMIQLWVVINNVIALTSL